MKIFTIRDMRERSHELAQNAEAGKLSIVTRHGRPLFVAVPFDEAMVKGSVGVALAVKLFEQDTVSLGKAAKLAGMPQGGFVDYLATLNIPAVRYGKDELGREVAAFE